MEKPIIAIVQARLGSTRFPEKILQKVNDKPMLEHIIATLKSVRNIHDVVLATTTNPIDNALVDLCSKFDVEVFRGSETDVLERYYLAAQKYHADYIVRIPSDNPFLYPQLIEYMVDQWILARKHESVDYMSNILANSFPIGLHIEIFTREALNLAHKNASMKDEREHVTPYIYNNSSFSCENIYCDNDFSNYRLTVDYPIDLLFANCLAKRLQNTTINDVSQIIEAIEMHPSLASMNDKFYKSQAIKNPT